MKILLILAILFLCTSLYLEIENRILKKKKKILEDELNKEKKEK